MRAELLKYQHYLLFLAALLLANSVLLPLTEWQTQQQQNLYLLQKKQSKTERLVTHVDEFESINKQLELYLSKSDSYLFTQKSVAEFKLTAQAQVEKMLQTSDCLIERIGFKGNQQLLPNVEKWFIEIRYKGDVTCLLKATRAFETTTPYMNIEHYSYNARAFDKNASGEFNAVLGVSVWYKNIPEGKA